MCFAAARAMLAATVWIAALWGVPAGASGEPSVFVHLFEWKWADVAMECEQWLGPKGFRAVQVSPPNEHIAHDAWWARYQPVTYRLVSRSGDEDSFADMVRRCKDVGVGVYADAVFNHIAAGSGTSIAGSPYGGRATPIYSPNDMHHDSGNTGRNCGVSDYTDKQNVQYCDLVGLPDLCTSCDYVRETVAAYLNHLAGLGVAGIRIDAAKHMDSAELAGVLSGVNGSLWRFQEVISGANEAVRPEMYYLNGAVTEFNYARTLGPNFLDASKLHYLDSFGEGWGLMPGGDAVVFLDNHDTQRGEAQLTYKSGKLYQLANIFMLAHPYGYPKVMSSYYFDSHDQGPPSMPVHGGGGAACGGVDGRPGSGAPWVCEHRWPPIANMVAWRRAAGDASVTHFQAPGDSTVAFCRGAAACVALNRQESASWDATLQLTLPGGAYCNVVESDDTAECPLVHVSAAGTATVQVPPLGAVALHIGKAALVPTRESVARAVPPVAAAGILPRLLHL